MVTSLRAEDQLDGAAKFRSWKTRILLILEENEIQNYVKENVPEPEDNEEKAKHKKNEAKANRILIDSVKDHLIPHISELKDAKKMFDTLLGLFKSKNTSRKLALRNQLRCITMTKSDSVAIYFMKISQLKDQLKAIGDIVDEAELVTISLNELSSSWDSFVQSICGRENLPKFDRLWMDYVQEEARVLSKNSLQKPQDDEGTQALAVHARKGKGKRNLGKKNTGRRSSPAHEHKKKDLSRIKCWNCSTFGHYASHCPERKRKGKQHASTTDVDEQ